MAHPDPVAVRYVGEQRSRQPDLDLGPAELRDSGTSDLAAEYLRHRLEAVADPEDGHAGAEDRRVELWGPLGVHRLWSATQDDRLRAAGEHLGGAHRVRNDLGVDLRLTDPPCDQLGVLRSEVDDEDEVMVDAHTGPFGSGQPAASRQASSLPGQRPLRIRPTRPAQEPPSSLGPTRGHGFARPADHKNPRAHSDQPGATDSSDPLTIRTPALTRTNPKATDSSDPLTIRTPALTRTNPGPRIRPTR